jgi:predicted membrane metal-binding protein
MAVVAGVVFFFVRAFLALIPGLALRRPIKKWAALAALLVATFYLELSGAEVATQRSYFMTAIVLVGSSRTGRHSRSAASRSRRWWCSSSRPRRWCIRASRCPSRQRWR